MLKKFCPNPDSTQYGGIINSSTTHALIHILQPVYDALDKGNNCARILMIDFSKAFDHIHHEFLLNKLKQNGTPDILLHWYENFLTNRQQRVLIKGSENLKPSKSNWTHIFGGVPQGTLSGLEMFIHMASDLRPPLTTIKYVDDTTIVETFNTTSNMQSSLNYVEKWSKDNHLYLNSKKTKELIISKNGRSEKPTTLVTSEGQKIEQVSQAKLLGVLICDNLKWNQHVNLMEKKAAKRIYFLRILRRSGLKQKQLLRVYTALIRPVCEYAVPVWGVKLPSYLDQQLETIQKRSVHIIAPEETSYTSACRKLNIPTLTERRAILCKIFFEKMKKPDSKLNFLIPQTHCTSDYNLRQEKVKYDHPIPKLKRTETSFVNYCLENFK
jgi:hypothetical protein